MEKIKKLTLRYQKLDIILIASFDLSFKDKNKKIKL